MRLPASVGGAELDLLRYIEEHHPLTVREAAEHLHEARGLTRTTALNMMERLRKKGYLRREKIAGVFHYSPQLEKNDVTRGLIRDFIAKTLQGSVTPLMAYLSEEVTLTEAQVEELKRIVETLDKGGQEKEEQG